MALRRFKGPSPKFHVFTQLPKELRVLIWEAAMPDPRVIHLRYQGDRGLKSRTPVPTLLFVCRESFEVMSRYYTKSFGTVLWSASTWFNFQKDTLYIDNQLKKHLPYLYLDTIHVQNLAIYSEASRTEGLYRWGDHHMPMELLLHKALRLFPNVQKLTIITFQYLDHKGLDIIFKEPFLLLPITAQQRLDEARKYRGPYVNIRCRDIARDDRDGSGNFRPVDVGQMEALKTTPEKNNRPELNETQFETVRAILNRRKPSPLRFERLEKLERLRVSLTASDRQAWTIPKEIKVRIATDSKGSKELNKRGEHMMQCGIVSGDRHAYTKTEEVAVE
ncbi:uncharacterized protein PAC_12888 [Phialocephala subalpina]|uniref:2EXR domain-containing protein n=1 Tax=Phialocephala subalpina TaxID=576137 RepID=A0A1L7XD88_9HELO|nr:uncharacterized protein PAC_12888 [Phialocephala subalpina]